MILTPDDLIDDIEGFTLGGRSLQKTIGLSEIGMTCRRCVARKLAEVEKSKTISSFRTTIGRYFHEGVATELAAKYAGTGAILLENGVVAHQYKGRTFRGSSDVFLPNEGHGMVLDWKCVGDDTLEDMRKREEQGLLPKMQYVIQGQLYGLGFERLGYPVEEICIMFVPANKGNLRRYHVKFVFAYDRTIALAALAEIEVLIDRAEVEGWDAVIRSQTEESGCLSCPSYRKADNPQLDMLGLFPDKLKRAKERS